MDTETSDVTDEFQLRKIMDDWAQAIRAKDSKGLATHVAPHVLLFDLITPLRYIGADALRKRAEEWLSSFQGPIRYETRDLSITAGDGVAFCHSLNEVSGTTTEGQKINMWWRATVCFQKVGGKWVVTHEHSSVPFDMQSGNAALDLKP